MSCWVAAELRTIVDWDTRYGQLQNKNAMRIKIHTHTHTPDNVNVVLFRYDAILSFDYYQKSQVRAVGYVEEGRDVNRRMHFTTYFGKCQVKIQRNKRMYT